MKKVLLVLLIWALCCVAYAAALTDATARAQAKVSYGPDACVFIDSTRTTSWERGGGVFNKWDDCKPVFDALGTWETAFSNSMPPFEATLPAPPPAIEEIVYGRIHVWVDPALLTLQMDRINAAPGDSLTRAVELGAWRSAYVQEQIAKYIEQLQAVAPKTARGASGELGVRIMKAVTP
jgi:hypothetical protein